MTSTTEQGWRLRWLEQEGKRYIDADRLLEWLRAGGYEELVEAMEKAFETPRRVDSRYFTPAT